MHSFFTDKVRLERQLFYTKKMEAIGTLAAGIAHDFNNILAAVLGHAGAMHEAIATLVGLIGDFNLEGDRAVVSIDRVVGHHGDALVDPARPRRRRR